MEDTYGEFVDKIKESGKLITKAAFLPLLNVRSDIGKSTYSVTDSTDVSVKKVEIKNGNYYVDIVSATGISEDVKIGLPGIHNVENAVGAYAIAEKMGVEKSKIKAALESYKGVQRRFETHVKTNNFVYIDDYAHHPSELEMSIKSARELYPTKKITGIFQPHLYTRTRDFVDGFAESLSLLDELILLDIYPARELPIAGVSSEIILNEVTIPAKSIVSKENLLNTLLEKDVEVLLTLGAGDIDVFVHPIKEQLTKRAEKAGE